jgi:hypothetical protein
MGAKKQAKQKSKPQAEFRTLRDVKKARRMTYEQMSEHIFNVTGVVICAALVAQYAVYQKIMSPRRADIIHAAFPEITREHLMYAPKENAA